MTSLSHFWYSLIFSYKAFSQKSLKEMLLKVSAFFISPTPPELSTPEVYRNRLPEALQSPCKACILIFVLFSCEVWFPYHKSWKVFFPLLSSWKVCITSISPILNVWENLPMATIWPGVFSMGRFLTVDSLIIDSRVLRLAVYSWVSSGNLYFISCCSATLFLLLWFKLPFF